MCRTKEEEHNTILKIKNYPWKVLEFWFDKAVWTLIRRSVCRTKEEEHNTILKPFADTTEISHTTSLNSAPCFLSSGKLSRKDSKTSQMAPSLFAIQIEFLGNIHWPWGMVKSWSQSCFLGGTDWISCLHYYKPWILWNLNL